MSGVVVLVYCLFDPGKDPFGTEPLDSATVRVALRVALRDAEFMFGGVSLRSWT